MKYRTIVADPPWDYEGKTPPWRSTSEQTYPLMSVERIAALPVDDLAAADAHLYLWAVLPLLDKAFDVIRAWGFTYETTVTWCKQGRTGTRRRVPRQHRAPTCRASRKQLPQPDVFNVRGSAARLAQVLLLPAELDRKGTALGADTLVLDNRRRNLVRVSTGRPLGQA